MKKVLFLFFLLYGSPTGYSYSTNVNLRNVTTYTVTGGDIANEYAITYYDSSLDGTDDRVDRNESWFSIAIAAVNDAPVATFQDVAATEQTPVTITLTGTDPEGQTLTYIITSIPQDGTLSDNGTVITADNLPHTTTSADVVYVSTSDSAEEDNFTFKVNDGELDSTTAWIDILIEAVFDDPIAESSTVEAIEQVTLELSLGGSNPDDDGTGAGADELVYIIISLPENGTLFENDNNYEIKDEDLPHTILDNDIWYTSTSDTATSDSFTFKVNVNTDSSAAATVSIVVTAVNDVPVATAQTDVAATEQTEVTITLAGTDPDGTTPVIFKIISLPSDGTLSDNGTVITADDLPKTTTSADVVYISTSDTATSDSFTFKVNDGTVDSEAATVSLAITAVNDAPIATAQTDVAATEQTEVTITLAGTDPDGTTPVIFKIISLPSDGTLSDNGTVITADDLPKTTTSADVVYVSTSDTATSDSFTFKVNDGTVDSEAATVSIAITAVNDAPVAVADSATVLEDAETTSIDVIANDKDDNDAAPVGGGFPLDFETATTWVDFGGGVVTTVSNPDTSGNSSSNVGKMVKNAGDTWGGSLLVLDVAMDFTTNDTFTMKVWSPRVGATVLLKVEDSNDAANSHEITATTTVASAWETLTFDYSAINTANSYDNLILIFDNGTSGDGSDNYTFYFDDIELSSSSLSLTAVSSSGSGIVAINTDGVSVDYTPALNFNGAETITYTVSDGVLTDTTGTLTITVTAVNDAPVATAQTDVAATEQTEFTISLAGTDADSDTLSYVISTLPTNGTLSDSGTVITSDDLPKTTTSTDVVYVSTSDTATSDSFTFKVNDGTVDSEAATVSIAITAVNDEPTKVNLSSLVIDENSAATEIGTLSTDDLDTNDTFTYELVSGEGDTDNSLFTIDTDKLKNTDAFDFETKSSYSIRIKSTDSGSASIEGVFA
ncbi:Ig-like domain-containing protein, partial [bacterium]|nr:Ig-like domain-containing protein [bacterium]